MTELRVKTPSPAGAAVSPNMLSVGLPDYDVAINRMFNEICNRFHMLDAILRLFPPKEMVHGGTTRQVSNPRILDTMMRHYRATVSVDQKMLLQTDAAEFRNFLVSMITSLQDQQRAHTFEVLSDTSVAVGTYIDGKGRNFWDLYIEGLEKLEFGFDEEGKPECTFYLPSDVAARATSVRPTEEQMKRASQVIDRRRQKYFANRRYRRLSMSAAMS